MRPLAAAVGDEGVLVAASVEQSVGENLHVAPSPVVVDGLGQPGQQSIAPGKYHRVNAQGPKGIEAENLSQ
jgi:hypothetical protein